MLLRKFDLNLLLWSIECFQKSISSNTLELQFFLIKLAASKWIDNSNGESAFSHDFQLDIKVVISEGNARFGCLHLSKNYYHIYCAEISLEKIG